MRFIDYFKFLREKYEVTSTELLEALSTCGCEIKKGSLSHKLSGERKINCDELEIFIEVLQPSVAEESRLRELYKIYDFGETEFEEVKLIKEYIEQFDNNTIVQFDEFNIELENISEINDDRLLTAVMVKLLSNAWGKDSIEIMCQPENTKLIDLLLNLSNKSTSKVRQLVCFNNDYKNDSNIYNIRCLSVLDKLVIRNPAHTIHYFYDKVNARANALTVFPFFITAGNKALFLSHDFKTGYLVHEISLVNKLRSEFERIFQQSHELFQVIENDIEYMKLCNDYEKTANNLFYTLQFHPCVCFNGDEKITRSCIRDDHPYSDVIMGYIKSRWENPRKIQGYHLYSAMGTQDFLKSGITTDMSNDLFVPVEEKYRRIVLDKVKLNTERIGVEINDSFIRVPYKLSVDCYDSGIVLLSYRDASGSRLILKERSLYKSMMNFFKYLYGYERTDMSRN